MPHQVNRGRRASRGRSPQRTSGGVGLRDSTERDDVRRHFFYPRFSAFTETKLRLRSQMLHVYARSFPGGLFRSTSYPAALTRLSCITVNETDCVAGANRISCSGQRPRCCSHTLLRTTSSKTSANAPQSHTLLAF